jgi:hypothetical protein
LVQPLQELEYEKMLPVIQKHMPNTCSTTRRFYVVIKIIVVWYIFWLEDLKRRCDFEDLGVDGKIMLELVLRK